MDGLVWVVAKMKAFMQSSHAVKTQSSAEGPKKPGNWFLLSLIWKRWECYISGSIGKTFWVLHKIVRHCVPGSQFDLGLMPIIVGSVETHAHDGQALMLGCITAKNIAYWAASTLDEWVLPMPKGYRLQFCWWTQSFHGSGSYWSQTHQWCDSKCLYCEWPMLWNLLWLCRLCCGPVTITNAVLLMPFNIFYPPLSFIWCS